MACTVFGILTSDTGPLLASNSDNPYGTRTRVVVDTVDDVKFVGTRIRSTEAVVQWDDMITRAVNDRGFAFTWSSVPIRGDKRDGEGIQEIGHQLAGCTSIEDGISVLQNGDETVSGCFLFADSGSNEVAAVEASGGETSAAQITETESVVETNEFEEHRLADRMADEDENPYRRTAVQRRCRGRDHLEHVSTLGDLSTLLCDHWKDERDAAYGGSICNHGREYGTVSSEILAPEDGTLYYAFGWPCGERDPVDALETPWGAYLSFALSLPSGTYTTLQGDLSASGMEAIASGRIKVLE